MSKTPRAVPVLFAAGVAAALAAGTGTASGAAGTHPSQGKTKREVVQQAIAEGGLRTGKGDRMDVTTDDLTKVPSEAALATGAQPTSVGMMMPNAATSVQGPTNLPTNVGGSWNNYAFTIPNAPAAAGTASSAGAVHSVQLSNGKVLIMAGSGNQWQNLQAGKFTTWLWNPDLGNQAGAWTLIPTPYDMFCSGHAILPNGNVLIAGGTTSYPQYDAAGNLVHDWNGSKQSYIFDINSNQYVQTGSMTNARWYPTIVSTGDGKQLIVSGLDDKAQSLGVASHYTDTVEQYDPAKGGWAGLPSMDFTTTDPAQKTAAGATNSTRTFGYYPNLILADTGQLFYSGSSNGDNGIPAGFWDWKTGGWTGLAQLPQPYQRNASSTVLLPPAQAQKVMVMGGGDYSLPTTNDTEIFDLHAKTMTKGPALSANKMYVGGVVLPDYTVFETNGASQFRAGGVHTAETYNPATNTFTVMNSPVIDRLYHSEAFLRPDGTVVTLGSQPLDGTFNLTVSVYSPPYLFKGQRPTVAGGVAAFDYSGAAQGPFTITTAPGTTVAKASLLRPSATTHSTDPDQRLVDLTVTKNADGTYALASPTNSNLIPPGQYMLFVTDSAGVPSVAKWVSVGTGTVTPPPPPAAGRSLSLTDTMSGWEAHFTATSSIAAAGQDIVLQVLTNGVWTYATNYPTDATGTSHFTWGGGGTSQFRAYLPGNGTTPETVSPTVTVTYGP